MNDAKNSIPTTDAAEALAFCRRLAGFLGRLPGGVDGALAAPTPTPDVSVVIPVFNEQDGLAELYARLSAVLQGMGIAYEVVFVDDGSRDRSLTILDGLADKDPRVVVVALSRNFGHQVAISAGLDHARGNGVAIMDADLQDPPEVLPEMVARWREGNDVVYAVRMKRKEGWVKRAAYAAFYRIFQRLANVDMPLDAGDFCVMDRKVVNILCAMPERNRFVRGIRSWVGLRQVGLSYARQARHVGEPKYTLSRLVVLALDGIISFSHVPLRMASLTGFGISLLALLLAAYYFVKKILVGLEPRGFATLIVAILFMAGIQIMTIGVVGEYVGHIFDEVKRRPLYLVRRVTRAGGGSRAAGSRDL